LPLLFPFPALFRSHVAIPARIWGWLLTASGVWMAFSWGANDVANATGVIVGASLMSPFAASLVGGLAIVLGIATWGYRVMETVGTRITHLIPPMAFIAEVAAALNVQLYTLLGLPASTTHSIVGAVFGVGLALGRAARAPRTARDPALPWPPTPLAAGFVSAVLFLLLARIV